MSEQSRMADNVGVVDVEGHPEPICYELVEEIARRSEPYHGGGQITHKIPTGRFRIGAVRYLGLPAMELDQVIATAIRADCAKRGIELAP